MVAAKVSFRTENGLVENLKFSSGRAKLFGCLPPLLVLSSTRVT